MYIEAIFSNIANRINEIESAEQSAYIAVAWFINKYTLTKTNLFYERRNN